MPRKRILAVLAITALVAAAAAQTDGETVTQPNRTSLAQIRAVLWEHPKDITTRDLFYGIGGAGRQPKGPFSFLKEDMGGSTPKFLVRDTNGDEWMVKLGKEAQAETAATRLVWAAGYYTDEDYTLPVLQVQGMPRLTRGQEMVEADGSMRNARLERPFEGGKFAGSWKWMDNPFVNTRELNGLRVIMALLNNWDLKDSNTAVYVVQDSAAEYTIGSTKNWKYVYLVSDLGASFGHSHYVIPSGKSNVRAYSKSKMVRNVEEGDVDFRAPGAAPMLSFFAIPHFFHTLAGGKIRAVGRDIPRSDARWIGDLLSQLSKEQLRQAFQGAGYPPEEVEAFAEAVAIRIAQLTEL